jgi:hypothetical protein
MSHLFSRQSFTFAFLVSLSTATVAQPVKLPQPKASLISAQSQHPEDPDQLQAFTGIIVMSAGVYFLKDDATKTLYGLDNQELAHKFADRVVAVTGTLDKSRTIHIKDIEEPKA